MRCIFCGEEFDPQKNKPEHILLDSLGGRKKTSKVDCSKCNERFGGTIDKAVAESVSQIRTVLNLKSGSGNLPPVTKNIELESGDKINILPGGRPEFAKSLLSNKALDEDRTEIKIGTPNIEKMKTILPVYSKKFSPSDEDTFKFVEQGQFWSEREYLQDKIPIRLALGGKQQVQSHAKSIMVLLAFCIGNEEVSQGDFDEILSFILDDGEVDSDLIEIDHREFEFLSDISSN